MFWQKKNKKSEWIFLILLSKQNKTIPSYSCSYSCSSDSIIHPRLYSLFAIIPPSCQTLFRSYGQCLGQKAELFLPNPSSIEKACCQLAFEALWTCLCQHRSLSSSSSKLL